MNISTPIRISFAFCLALASLSASAFAEDVIYKIKVRSSDGTKNKLYVNFQGESGHWSGWERLKGHHGTGTTTNETYAMNDIGPVTAVKVRLFNDWSDRWTPETIDIWHPWKQQAGDEEHTKTHFVVSQRIGKSGLSALSGGYSYTDVHYGTPTNRKPKPEAKPYVTPPSGFWTDYPTGYIQKIDIENTDTVLTTVLSDTKTATLSEVQTNGTTKKAELTASMSATFSSGSGNFATSSVSLGLSATLAQEVTKSISSASEVQNASTSGMTRARNIELNGRIAIVLYETVIVQRQSPGEVRLGNRRLQFTEHTTYGRPHVQYFAAGSQAFVNTLKQLKRDYPNLVSDIQYRMYVNDHSASTNPTGGSPGTSTPGTSTPGETFTGTTAPSGNATPASSGTPATYATNLRLVEKHAGGRLMGYFRRTGNETWREESAIDAGRRDWKELGRDQFSVYLESGGAYIQIDLHTKLIYYSTNGFQTKQPLYNGMNPTT